MDSNNKHDFMDARSAGAAPGFLANAQAGIKMARYRLDVGCKHQVTSEDLKKLLIEESGVDKNNIKINIQNDYTLVDMPDEMPQDIFMHLKSVEINQHKLDIKRVKTRKKKLGDNYRRRGRARTSKSRIVGSDPVNGG